MLSININNVLKVLMINVIGNTWVLCNLFLSPIMAEFEYVCPTYPESEKYEKCEFSKKTYKIPKDRPVRIYVDGIYDLLHYGHMLNFKQAKELFENVYLIVGVCNDELTHKYKGQTVQTHEERLESVRHVRYVDEVIEHAPWSIDQEFIDKHKIDYVAHDDAPYIWNKAQAYKAENTEEREATDSSDSEEVTAQVFDPNDVYYYVKSNGMFIPTVRARNVSTSVIITKIIKNYDQFVMRNLERGATAKELNVGPFKELDLKVKKLFGEELGKAKEEILLAMKFWESRSSDFLKLYGENVDKIKAAIANKKDDLNTHGFLGTCEKVVKKLRNGNMDEIKKDQ